MDHSDFMFYRFLLSLFLFIGLVSIPINRMGVNGEISEFKAVQTSLLNARENKGISQFEIAAIQQKVVDSNKWLASYKYYNSISIIEWWIPDSVDKLEPIQ
jgi:hypothetical protein